MLNQQTIEKLHAMRMRGMADAFTQQQEEPQTAQLSFEERFALLVDRQWNWRQNRALERRLKEGRLQGPACIEDIDFRAARGLDKQVVRSLIHDSEWVRRHQHIFLVGPTGIGKTFLARAFGQKACRDGFTAYFATASQLFRELEMARADGSYVKRLRGLGQVDVLIVDDWAMAPLAETERRAFLEICDERYLTRSTLLTSQLPVAKWHAQIGDPTVADSILDRLVHGAHRIELQGESMRKKKVGRGGKDAEQEAGRDVFPGANSSRPTGSLRQRPEIRAGEKGSKATAPRQRKPPTLLTDVDHCFTLRKPCVASLRSDRHQIGMTDRHHRNAQSANAPASSFCFLRWAVRAWLGVSPACSRFRLAPSHQSRK